MTLQDLLKYCQEQIAKHPQIKWDIIECYQMAEAEVHDGEPERHECEKAMDDIEELLAVLQEITGAIDANEYYNSDR